MVDSGAVNINRYQIISDAKYNEVGDILLSGVMQRQTP